MRAGVILAFFLLFGIHQAGATTKNPAMVDVVEYDPLQDSHLIVRGTIAAVRHESVALADWFSKQPSSQSSNVRRDIESIEVVVSEVIKGKVTDGRVKFMVVDDWPFVEAQEVVICAKYVVGRSETALFTSAYIGMYVRDGDNVFKKCVMSKSEPDVRLDYSSLLQRVEEGGLVQVTNAADLVLRGTIASVSESTYSVPDGRVGKLRRFRLTTSEVMKGQSRGGEIEFVVPRVDGSYVPTWYRVVPRGMSVGQEWIVFLRKGELGYYLFSGPNSALLVRGGELIYDMAVTLPLGLEQASKVIRAEVLNENR